MWVRDCLEGLWRDEDFASWYPKDGRPGFSPARLATVSVLQFLLNPSDRQAAEAVRCRIDVKYALAMELEDPGFHHSILSDFRDRLCEDDRADALLSLALDRLRSAGLLVERGRQRTDSTHIWSAARDLTRLEMVLEAVRAALEETAVHAPEVLDGLVDQNWAARYGRPVRLPAQPSRPVGRLGEAGRDARLLLERLTAAGPLRARANALRRILVQNFLVDPAGRMRPRRPADGVPKAARRLASPYDTEARRAIRGNTRWAGYLVHVTETCDDGPVNLITDIATTGPVRDTQALPGIHNRLDRRSLLPAEHLVDGGYLSVEQLHHSHNVFGIDLVGPVKAWCLAEEDCYRVRPRRLHDRLRRSHRHLPRRTGHPHLGLRTRYGPLHGRPFPARTVQPVQPEAPLHARSLRTSRQFSAAAPPRAAATQPH
jgi:transposase